MHQKVGALRRDIDVHRESKNCVVTLLVMSKFLNLLGASRACVDFRVPTDFSRLNMRKPESGFTLIELMIVLVIVAIFAAIALPNLSNNIIRGDLTQAQANISQALRSAKNEARGRNTRISVAFVNGTSSLTLTSTDGGLAKTILLPNTVTITSASATYTFSPIGIVDLIGTITITSSRDAAQNRSVAIANLLGQITAS